MRKGVLAALLVGFVALGTSVSDAGIIDALKVMQNNKPPAQAFDVRLAPPAPDYRDASSWAARPETRDAADVTPLGVTAIDQRRADVDVFFVYPTVFFSQTDWNADVRDPAYRQQVDGGPMRGQASVFNGCCRIYAPHYRQMTLGGFVKWSANSESAMDLAYGDVLRAFNRYLDDDNNGRPFIIAGHSQGSRLARRLIAERIDGRPIARRLVAAYLPGHWIESDWFKTLRDVKACERADDLGCVATWSTFEEGRNATSQRLLLGRTSDYAPERIRRPYACINPVSWTTGPLRAPKALNRGAWLHGSGARPRAPDVGLLSTRCKDGALYVSKAPQPYQALVIPFGNYHNMDYNVAYMNLRENAALRAASFVERGR